MQNFWQGREDVILASLAILLNRIEILDIPVLEVIDSDLLEEILLEGMGEMGNPGCRSSSLT